jgi:hypothetical protein
MKSIDVRGLIMVMLTATICLTILLVITIWAIVGPEHVPQVARDRLHELMILLIGMISGYLAGNRANHGSSKT